MEENVFLIKWYGPFDCKEDIRDWEQEQSFKSSLYLLHGKCKYAKKARSIIVACLNGMFTND